jgi:hypothetical protein
MNQTLRAAALAIALLAAAATPALAFDHHEEGGKTSFDAQDQIGDVSAQDIRRALRWSTRELGTQFGSVQVRIGYQIKHNVYDCIPVDETGQPIEGADRIPDGHYTLSTRYVEMNESAVLSRWRVLYFNVDTATSIRQTDVQATCPAGYLTEGQLDFDFPEEYQIWFQYEVSGDNGATWIALPLNDEVVDITPR